MSWAAVAAAAESVSTLNQGLVVRGGLTKVTMLWVTMYALAGITSMVVLSWG